MSFLIGAIVYIFLFLRLAFLSDYARNELRYLHQEYVEHFNLVKKLVDYAEGDHVLPQGRYFELTRGPLAEASAVLNNWDTDTDHIAQDDKMYQKLRTLEQSIHVLIAADGRFKEEYHYQEQVKMLQENEKDIAAHWESYNLEAANFNKKRSGLLYILHRFWMSPYKLLGPRADADASH